jgi:Uma2 family endonuclease
MPLTQINWQDVQQLPEDGNRHEAIGGELYMTATPVIRHQLISHRLQVALDRILVESGIGLVMSAPVGVEFPATGEGVQPDIVFVSKARRGIIGDDWIRGAPDLVIEILSPSTAHRDRGIKLRLYERQGVEEYWIVDLDAEAVEVWTFDDGAQVRRFTDRLRVSVRDETVGEIDLTDIFRAG